MTSYEQVRTNRVDFGHVGGSAADRKSNILQTGAPLAPALRCASSDPKTPPIWTHELERGRWPGWIIDDELKLRYVTRELKTFMTQSLGREIDDAAAGSSR